MDKEEKIGLTGLVVAGFVILAAIIGFFMWIIPNYSVWRAGMVGRATLQHADFERQVQVVNAQANLQAQKYNAEAEVARAGGVAQANKIISGSITDQYIRYLWVQTLDNTKNQIIYVPLGADGLPVTEAGRGVTAPTK